MDTLRFDFYGIGVTVECDNSYLAAMLSEDFRFFAVDALSAETVALTVRHCPSPASRIPPIPAAGHTPAHVRFDTPEGRFVLYHSGAVIFHARNTRPEEATLWYSDETLSYEKLYLFILSRVGEALDRRGLHRVHALGFAYHGTGVLVVLPMRGGKSTLALSLRDTEGLQLLSEDTPLIDHQGFLLPFPLRLSLRNSDVPEDLRRSDARTLLRDTFEPKTLLSLRELGFQVAHERVRAAHLLFGRWTGASTPSLVPASRLRGIRELFTHSVVGLGLPQVVEFFLYSGAREVAGKGALTVQRISAAVRLVRQCRLLEFRTCRDPALNRSLLLEYLANSEKCS